MADTKISALTELAATPANTDLAVVVDVSDTSMAASGTNKKITIANLLAGVQPLDSDLTAIAALTTTAYGRSLLEAANAAALRTLAGTVIGTDVQAYDSDLAAIAALTTTAFGRALLELANAGALRTAAGVGTISTANQSLQDTAPSSPTDGDRWFETDTGKEFIRSGGVWVEIGGGAATGDLVSTNNLSDLTNASTARTNLGLGTIATQNSNSVTITGGAISGITDLPVADGGTGASNASTARTNLGVVIGTDVQAFHARLADIAGITFAQGDILYHDGSNIVKLAAGTSGHFLKTQGAAANPTWAAVGGGGDLLASNNLSDVSNTATALTNLGGVAKSLVDAKGDLYVGTADNTVARQAVGTDGHVLTADSAQANGIKWAAASGTATDDVASFMAYHADHSTVGGGYKTLNMGVANRAMYFRVLRGNVAAATRIRMYVGTSAGNVDFGVYRGTPTAASPASASRIQSTGSIACPGGGDAAVTITSHVVKYPTDWIACVADGTTATVLAGDHSISSNGSAVGTGFNYLEESAFPLPATAGASPGVANWNALKLVFTTT